MTKKLMIFLMLCGIAAADRNCLVGGSSSNELYAGWFDPDLTSVAASDNGNGAAVITMVAVVYDHTGGTVEKMLSKAGIGVGVELGMYAYISGTNITTGRYEVTTIAGDDSYIACTGLVATGDNSDSVVNIGGAVPATYNAVSYDLEDVLDSSIGDAASQDILILIYLASAQEITEQIMVDSNGGSGAFRKTLRGVDSSYAALSNGSYTEYIDTDDNAAGNIFNISVSNITFENIAAANPDGDVQPASGIDCFEVTGNEFVARNCRAVNGYYGFHLGAYSNSLIDCVAYDNFHYQVYSSANIYVTSIIGGYYEFNRNKAYVSTSYILRLESIGSAVISTTLVGGTVGIYLSQYGSNIVLNCNLKDQTVYGIQVNNALAVLLAFNNIIKLADSVNDVAIVLSAGSAYEDYNITNATSANSGFTGANSVSELALSDTSPWTDAASDNYKLDRTDGLIANALEAGWSPYSIGGLMGAQSIGAFPTYDLPAKSNVVSADTVYGETGTNAGNGGIGSVVGVGWN